MQKVKIKTLNAAAFAPFGEVIESAGAEYHLINDGRFERYHALSKVDLNASDDTYPIISLFKCARATSLPYTLKLMEKHPVGSQAFMPLNNIPFVIAVAKSDAAMKRQEIYAFKSNGNQGINLSRGIWHMPLIAPGEGLEFLVVDREGPGTNCIEMPVDPPVQICPEGRE